MVSYENQYYRMPHFGSFYDKTEYRGIGGDRYDISTWRPVERREANFDRKDPFTRTMINAVKQGRVMYLG